MDKLQEIDLYFNQLKELRNATITYAQMAKRDKNRPPVRPICRRLSVNKLSEIKSDSDLYEAVCCYVFDDCDDDDNGDIISERRKAPTIDTLHNQQSFHPSPSKSFSSPTPSAWSTPATHTQGTIVTPSDALIYDEHVPPVPEFRILLDCVLAVRVSWDRYNRLDVFAHDFSIDQNLLLKCLKSVCGSIGCIRLDLNIDIGAVMNAVESYYQTLSVPRALAGSNVIPSQLRQSVKYPSSASDSRRNGVHNHTNVTPLAHSSFITYSASSPVSLPSSQDSQQQFSHQVSSLVSERSVARASPSYPTRSTTATSASALPSPSHPTHASHIINSSLSPSPGSHQMNPNSRVFSPHTVSAGSNNSSSTSHGFANDDSTNISVRLSTLVSNSGSSMNPSELSTPYISPRTDSSAASASYATPLKSDMTSLSALRAMNGEIYKSNDVYNNSSYDTSAAAVTGLASSMQSPLRQPHSAISRMYTKQHQQQQQQQQMYAVSNRDSLLSHDTCTSSPYNTRQTTASFDNSAIETSRDSLSDSSSYSSSLKSSGLHSAAVANANANATVYASRNSSGNFEDRNFEDRNFEDRNFEEHMSGRGGYLNNRADRYTTPSYSSYPMTATTTLPHANSNLLHIASSSSSSSSFSSATTAENNSRFESGGTGTGTGTGTGRFLKCFSPDESFVKVRSSPSLSSSATSEGVFTSRLMDLSNSNVHNIYGISSRKNTMDGLVDEERDVILHTRTRSSTLGTGTGTSSSTGPSCEPYDYDYEYMSPQSRKQSVSGTGALQSTAALSAITGSADRGTHVPVLLGDRNSSAGLYTHERMLGNSDSSSFFSSPNHPQQQQHSQDRGYSRSSLSPAAAFAALDHEISTGATDRSETAVRHISSSSSSQVNTPMTRPAAQMLATTSPYTGLSLSFQDSKGLDSRQLDFDLLVTPSSASSTKMASSAASASAGAGAGVDGTAVAERKSCYDVFWMKSFQLIKSSMLVKTFAEAVKSTFVLFKELNIFVSESVANGSMSVSVTLAHRLVSRRVVSELCCKLYASDIQDIYHDSGKGMMVACISLLEHQLLLQKQSPANFDSLLHMAQSEVHLPSTPNMQNYTSSNDSCSSSSKRIPYAGVIATSLEDDIQLLKDQMSYWGGSVTTSSNIISDIGNGVVSANSKHDKHETKWMRSLFNAQNHDRLTILNQHFLDLHSTLFLPSSQAVNVDVNVAVDESTNSFDVHTEIMKFRLHSSLQGWSYNSSSLQRGDDVCLTDTSPVVASTTETNTIIKYEEFISTHDAVVIGLGDADAVDVDLLAAVTCTADDWTLLTARRELLTQLRSLLHEEREVNTKDSTMESLSSSSSSSTAVRECYGHGVMAAAAWVDERARRAVTDCVFCYREVTTRQQTTNNNAFSNPLQATKHLSSSNMVGDMGSGSGSTISLFTSSVRDNSSSEPSSRSSGSDRSSLVPWGEIDAATSNSTANTRGNTNTNANTNTNDNTGRNAAQTHINAVHVSTATRRMIIMSTTGWADCEAICQAADRLYPAIAAETLSTTSAATTGTGTDTASSKVFQPKQHQRTSSSSSSSTEVDGLSQSVDKELAAITMPTNFTRFVYLKSKLAQLSHKLNQRQFNLVKHLSKYLETKCGYPKVEVKSHPIGVGTSIFQKCSTRTAEEMSLRHGDKSNNIITDMVASSAVGRLSNDESNELHTMSMTIVFHEGPSYADVNTATATATAADDDDAVSHDTNVRLSASCCLTIAPFHHPFYVISSHLISSYFRQDLSGKLGIFSGIVHRFIKENQLSKELSRYAWNILILHYLLKYEYLINIHDDIIQSLQVHYSNIMHQSTPPHQKQINEIIQQKLKEIASKTSFIATCESREKYQERINNISVFELLLSFFKYYSYEFNVIRSVVTLRGQGEVLSKSHLLDIDHYMREEVCAWRLVVEDLLSVSSTVRSTASGASGTSTANASGGSGGSDSRGWEMIDLGRSVTFTGQIEVFRTLRMAYHALYGMLHSQSHSHSPSHSHSDEFNPSMCVEQFLISGRLMALALAGGFSTAVTSTTVVKTESESEMEDPLHTLNRKNDSSSHSHVTHVSDGSDDPQQQGVDRLTAVDNSGSDISVDFIEGFSPESQSPMASHDAFTYVYNENKRFHNNTSAMPLVLPPVVSASVPAGYDMRTAVPVTAFSSAVEAILQQDDQDDYDHCNDQFDDYDQEVNNIISSAHSPVK